MTSFSSGFSVRTYGTKPRQPRRNTRVESPVLRIQIEGRSYRTVNWSLGGVLIAAYEGGLVEGDSFTIAGIGLEQGGFVGVSVPARVVRIKDGHLAGCYSELGGRAYDVLEALLMRRAFRMPAAGVAAAAAA